MISDECLSYAILLVKLIFSPNTLVSNVHHEDGSMSLTWLKAELNYRLRTPKEFSGSEEQTAARYFWCPDSPRPESNCFFSCFIKSCLIYSQYQQQQLSICFLLVWRDQIFLISALEPVAWEAMLPPLFGWSHFEENRKSKNKEVQVFRTQCCHFYLASSPVWIWLIFFCGLDNIERNNGEKHDNLISDCKMRQVVFTII